VVVHITLPHRCLLLEAIGPSPFTRSRTRRHTQDSTALSVSPREMSRRMDPVLGVRGHVVVHITSLGIAYDQIVPVLLGGARARGRAHYYLGVIYVPALYSRRVHI